MTNGELDEVKSLAIKL